MGLAISVAMAIVSAARNVAAAVNARLTESGDTRITEAGDIRIKEG